MNALKARRVVVRWGAGLLLAAVLLGVLWMIRNRPLGAWLAPLSARLEIVNLCDSRWQVSARSGENGSTRDWTIEPRQTVEVLLAADDYEITQTLIPAGKAKPVSRRFPIRLEKREAYRWPLVTLRDAEEDGGSRP